MRVPRVGLTTPETILRKVDLPAPFTPMMPHDSPRPMVRSMLSSARCVESIARPARSSKTVFSRLVPL